MPIIQSSKYNSLCSKLFRRKWGDADYPLVTRKSLVQHALQSSGCADYAVVARNLSRRREMRQADVSRVAFQLVRCGARPSRLRRHEGERVPDVRDLRDEPRLSLHRRKRPATGPADDEGRGRFAFFLRTLRPDCLSISKRRPLGCAGFARDPPKVVDQVRFLARALFQSVPRECVGRTAVFEAARPGSIPGRGTSFASCPWGVTDSHTTLRRSWTRFDSWRGHHFSTLEPDGQATGCNPVQVGSTPTGVSAGFTGRKGKVVGVPPSQAPSSDVG